MSRFEAIIRTPFGEIVVYFDGIEDLKASLENLDVNAASEMLRKKFESIIEIEARKQKNGLEGLYNFTSTNLVELTHVPETLSKPELLGLILFIYHPKSASTQSIAFSSGIKNASDYLTQTAYKKMWWKTQSGEYILSDDGLKWVSQKILPKITSVTISKDNPSVQST